MKKLERRMVGGCGKTSTPPIKTPIKKSINRNIMEKDSGMPQTFVVNIHAMPCTNRCLHCWTFGSPRHQTMNFEAIKFVFQQLDELRYQNVKNIIPLFLDEPTNHPRFIDIFKLQSDMGFVGENFFFPTNGSILAGLADNKWNVLRKYGLNWLQFSFYGLKNIHDEFARREGAFEDIFKTIRRAQERDINWYAGIILHSKNVKELPAIVDYLRSLHPFRKTRIGWFVFSYQGRGKQLERPIGNDIVALPEEFRLRGDSWGEEKQIIKKILGDESLASRKCDEPTCNLLAFDININLNVFCGGACDNAGILGAAPWLRKNLKLGRLSDDGFEPLIKQYVNSPPEPVKALREITWGELAQRYGDSNNEEVFYLKDLIYSKWASMYLEERYHSIV